MFDVGVLPEGIRVFQYDLEIIKCEVQIAKVVGLMTQLEQ